MARKSTTPPVQPILPSNEPSPAVTFSPAALQALLDEVTASRKAIADLTATVAANAQAANAKPPKAAKAGPTLSVAGKTDRSIQNEIMVIKAFKKAGYGNVTPHQNVKTFNKWMADNRRPIEGSKSLTVGNLRLFHVTQTREISSEEKAKSVAQQKAAIDRHTKANAKGTATVHQLTPQ